VTVRGEAGAGDGRAGRDVDLVDGERRRCEGETERRGERQGEQVLSRERDSSG